MNFNFIKGVIIQAVMFIGLIPKYFKFKTKSNCFSPEDIFKLIQNHSDKSLKSVGINLNISGRENLPSKDTNVLFVCNHPNWTDGFTLISTIDRPTGVIIAKDPQWDKFKFIDRWLDMLNCLHIDRDNPRAALKTIQEATHLLQTTSSMAIFPEGKVSQSEKLQPFKHGAFRMALRGSAPVVPIVIKDAADTYTLSSRWHGKLNKGTINVEILPPITEHLTNTKLNSKGLSDITFNVISQALSHTN